jgi:hypothetical protein
MVFVIMTFLALAVWSYTAVGGGGSWRCRERDDGDRYPPGAWPRLAVMIPACDEAEGIGPALQSTHGTSGLWKGRFQAVRAK